MASVAKGGDMQQRSTPPVKMYCLLLAIVAIALYANTLLNDHAFDDRMMILENVYVKKGFAGIPDLLTTTHLRGFIHLPNDKYRPLSLVMFAMEYGLFGLSPFIGHLVNILIFAGCVVLLFLFLRRLFGEGRTNMALIAALLFVAHPIHTEVVANIKSRDELLSYFFGLLSLLSFMAYAKTGKAMRLAGGMLLYLLALMSKENVITFLGIIPLVFLCYANEHRRRSIHIILGTVVSAAVFVGIAYTIIRINGTGLPHEASDLTLNALTAAPDAATRFATAFLALGIYIKLLVIPYPLLCNYSYAAIPFVDFSNVWVLLTVAVHVSLIGLGIYRLVKHRKDPLAFAILFYFIVMAMFSNLFAMLGSQVAERFLFLPSTGFCIALALGAEWIIGKGGTQAPVLKKALPILVPILLVFGGMTIARNSEWKNNATLFGTDVERSPNDCRLNFFMAGVVAPAPGTTDPNAYTEEIGYLHRALAIYPNFIQAHTSLAQLYATIGRYDSAYLHGIAALREKPDNSLATYTTGTALYALRRYPEAIQWLSATTRLAPDYMLGHLNLARCYADVNAFDSAIVYYRKTLVIEPNSLIALRGIAIAFLQTGRHDSAAAYMTNVVQRTGASDDRNNLGSIYVAARRYRDAIDQFGRIIRTDPSYTSAYINMAVAYEHMGQKDSAALYRAKAGR
ncbi:hypothetical protein GCM10023093_19130 [Nemorincola caseinilytica]|uniref:Dolichyl-phosphate-mannose--protein mannosyltransferase n=1 Tax=Nemorincola caseinilytica TaxID=2054315 RepID=A0ABP8NIE5_9BACT